MNSDRTKPPGLWTVLLLVLLAACAAGVWAQSKPTEQVKTPNIVLDFLESKQISNPETFFARAKDKLWSVYQHDEPLKGELLAYVQSAPDGPGLCFAGIALIPFHDPRTVKPMLDRVLDARTLPPTRWCLLNAAPYILAIGDGIYTGEGKLDREVRRIAGSYLKFAELASQLGLGRAHAAELRLLAAREKTDRYFKSFLEEYPQLPNPLSRFPKNKRPYILALWHFGAYLDGTLDLRDREALAQFLTPESYVLPNVMSALSRAANRDFERELRAADPSLITPEFLRREAGKALEWWGEYLRLNPSGDWLPAAVDGFREPGYDLEHDLQSEKSIRALLRAMDSESEILRYNAYRLLNRVFKTHFDLERILLADKYALSFLEPNKEKGQSEARLKRYWRARFHDLIQ